MTSCWQHHAGCVLRVKLSRAGRDGSRFLGAFETLGAFILDVSDTKHYARSSCGAFALRLSISRPLKALHSQHHTFSAATATQSPRRDPYVFCFPRKDFEFARNMVFLWKSLESTATSSHVVLWLGSMVIGIHAITTKTVQARERCFLAVLWPPRSHDVAHSKAYKLPRIPERRLPNEDKTGAMSPTGSNL